MMTKSPSMRYTSLKEGLGIFHLGELFHRFCYRLACTGRVIFDGCSKSGLVFSGIERIGNTQVEGNSAVTDNLFVESICQRISLYPLLLNAHSLNFRIVSDDERRLYISR